jgi:hypothetical protein
MEALLHDRALTNDCGWCAERSRDFNRSETRDGLVAGDNVSLQFSFPVPASSLERLTITPRQKKATKMSPDNLEMKLVMRRLS